MKSTSTILRISQHHYSGGTLSGGAAVLQALLDKTTIRSNLSAYIPDIAAVHARKLPYVLGETSNYAIHGGPNVSNVAGAALWSLDYAFFASQLGFERLYFHEGIGYKYNFVSLILSSQTLSGVTIFLCTDSTCHAHPFDSRRHAAR